ncbi:MAG: hypothetical protein AB8G23_14590 [Myxococcota bacterium]
MNRNQSHFRSRGQASGLVFSLLLLLAIGSLSASSAFAAPPKVGSPAPAFEFQGVDGALHPSSALYGETGVVVAWFPKAFTPG